MEFDNIGATIWMAAIYVALLLVCLLIGWACFRVNDDNYEWRYQRGRIKPKHESYERDWRAYVRPRRGRHSPAEIAAAKDNAAAAAQADYERDLRLYEQDYDEFKSCYRRNGIITGICVFVVVVVMFNGMLPSFSYRERLGTRPATLSEVAATYGIHSGKPVQVSLGARIPGTIVSGDVHGNLLGVNGSVSGSPGSSITLTYIDPHGYKWPFEIPLSEIQWPPSPDNAVPTVTFTLNDKSWDDLGSKVVYTYGQDRCGVDNLLLTCRHAPLLKKQLVIGPATKNEGLAVMLEHNLDKVSICVSEKVYNELMTQH